ncbi:MAG TPA: DinB family protein, partial [Thermomicrobiales bacterium]|nr:DinB family protein [Thermomicrobiales bacterium]
EGMTDAEYLWEPATGCWSIRPDATGKWVQDRTRPEPQPTPFTTIAWRMMHIADVFGRRASNQFGDGSFDLANSSLPDSVAGGLDFLRAQYENWHQGVAALDDTGLARPCGPTEPYYPDNPLAGLVLHIHREFLHHAAEIHLMRDLYGHTVGRDALTLLAPSR